MTTLSEAGRYADAGSSWRAVGRLACLGLACALTGCMSLPFGLGKQAEAPKPVDSGVIGVSATKYEKDGPDAKLYQELEGAIGQFRRALELPEKEKWKELAKAEKIFAKLCKMKKAPLPILEEARFYEAECQFEQRLLSKAESSYQLLLKEHLHCQFKFKAIEQLYRIADFWLNDTRVQMEKYEKNRSSTKFFAASFHIHWEKDKPFFDEEGRALICLEKLIFADMNGPYAEQAMFKLATVYFYRTDYRDADHFFTLLRERFPKSPYAAKAAKQSIICQQVINGGSDYDRRPLVVARRLVDEAPLRYRELEKEKDWLDRQVNAINNQQADGDFKTAEFYLRTHKLGAAYFCYELVRRRYPSTSYAEKSVQRMDEIRAKAEKEQRTQQQKEEEFRNTPPPPRRELLWDRILPASWRRQPAAPAAQSEQMPGEVVNPK